MTEPTREERAALALADSLTTALRERQARAAALLDAVKERVDHDLGYHLNDPVNGNCIGGPEHNDALREAYNAVIEAASQPAPAGVRDPHLGPSVTWPAGENATTGRRSVLVELAPIGEDGLCSGCGTKPTRETGSCRCLTSVDAAIRDAGGRDPEPSGDLAAARVQCEYGHWAWPGRCEHGHALRSPVPAEGLDVERLRDLKSAARAAYLYMNMVRCPDCHTSWPEGLVHPDCPALAPDPQPETPA